MKLAPIPFDEALRLDAVHRLRLLDTQPEERFDRITRLTQRIFDVPAVFITLVDRDRIWFKSKVGCAVLEEPRDVSFCGHTVCNVVTNNLLSRLLEVKDAKVDDRFQDNTFIIDECSVRYYMGFVLQSRDQRNLGTLCITDTHPRTFSAEEKGLFIDLGMMAEKELQDDVFVEKLEIGNDIGFENSQNASQEECANKLLSLNSKLCIVENQLNDYLENIGINFKEWCILNAIQDMKFATPNLLSKNLAISPSSMTKRLEKLETKNLINRWHSAEGDRRTVFVECSNKGIRYWRRGIVKASELENIHLRNLRYLN